MKKSFFGGRISSSNLVYALLDIVAVNLAYGVALWFRFDCNLSVLLNGAAQAYFFAWAKFTPIYSVLCLLTFFGFRFHKTLWTYAGYSDLIRIVLSSVITVMLHVVFITLLFLRMPISYYLIGAVLQTIAVILIHFFRRFIGYSKDLRTAHEGEAHVLLIGAGAAGQIILSDMHHSGRIPDRVACIIDDDPKKWGKVLDDVPIIGGRERILEVVERYDITKIYVAIPSASAQDRRDILNICKETDCELKILPGVYQFLCDEVTTESLREVSMEDLLGREPIRTDMEELLGFLSGKVVLVTGAGGSIGSELARQIAAYGPKLLVLFDIYENSLYEVQNQLQDDFPELNFVALIGSVRDSRRIYEVFETYRPEVVYHAAAHKHVPLMEVSPNEAIKNNVFGTYKTAYAAMVHGCKRFVLISSDKAVNPVNVMGASKRLCEMIVQAFDAKIKAGRAEEIPQLFTHRTPEMKKRNDIDFSAISTEFVAVRFGNVLGSNGSVVPLFRKMIEKGGPIKVTHPDIIRYFMTIPEAVSLVLLAGTYAKGGEIFVLDMGSPVKIDTLARNMIRLSGLRPDIDIEIEYTGLRPGEKLYEEKLMEEEGLERTDNDLIHIGKPIPFDPDSFFRDLRRLMEIAYANRESIRDSIMELVSTYHPNK